MWEAWKYWWNSLTQLERWWPLGFLVAYGCFLAVMNDLSAEPLRGVIAWTLLATLGRRFRRVALFLLPLILTSLAYDSQRYYAHFLRADIRVLEPYLFDLHFFGISTFEGVLTPNEWWQKHPSLILDFVTGIAYIVFVPVFVLTSAYIHFRVSYIGTNKMPAPEIAKRSSQLMWAFFWVNLIGYSTYYWYPAAPPWYVDLYGFGTPVENTPPGMAGCARFDSLTGIPMYKNFYGKSANIFGAIPSLHISYPLITVCYAFRFGTLRVFSTVFYLLMCFSAVYLNHHYILDIIWGSAYSLLCSYGLMAWGERRLGSRPISLPILRRRKMV